MAGKKFNEGPDDLDEIRDYDESDFDDSGYDDPGYDPEYDPGYDEPEYDEPDDEYESEYDESELEESEYDEDGSEESYEGDYDEIPSPIPDDDDEDFIYDEEGNSEPKPTVYYYKDEENYEEEMLYEEPEDEEEVAGGKKKMSLLKKILLGVGIFVLVLILFVLFLIFTPAGRRMGIGCVAGIVSDWMGTTVVEGELESLKLDREELDRQISELNLFDDSTAIRPEGPRSEDYVKTFLAFGIEEIGGASNTDAILLVSINKKDNTIKLTSVMRDTYVNIPGDYPNKINSVYARGVSRTENNSLKKAAGAALLQNVIENTFDVDISGYACVNFSSFEKIVDRLGGIDIELGEKEAAYLRKTNYISNPANRTVKAGWNHMNGNQVLGYCRVRKVVTLGGANNDYGRTVRHRRVINAIIAKFKETSIFDLIPIMKDCLGYIFTNLTDKQIEDVLVDIVENKIFTTESMRLPADEFFTDSGRKGIFNGKSNITYTLVLGDQLGKNIERFHQFLFLDGEGATDTSSYKGAGSGVQIGSSSSSSTTKTESAPKPTPTPTPEPEVSPGPEDESIPPAGESRETTIGEEAGDGETGNTGEGSENAGENEVGNGGEENPTDESGDRTEEGTKTGESEQAGEDTGNEQSEKNDEEKQAGTDAEGGETAADDASESPADKPAEKPDVTPDGSQTGEEEGPVG